MIYTYDYVGLADPGPNSAVPRGCRRWKILEGCEAAEPRPVGGDLRNPFGIPLFDRTTYRPALTEAGRALLPRARRIAEETNAFRDTARSLASRLEAELTIVLDSMFPMPAVVKPLRAFTAKFPTVPPRVYVQSLGAAAELVLETIKNTRRRLDQKL
jgi:DNA-binding transcriptional LysR family regulator